MKRWTRVIKPDSSVRAEFEDFRIVVVKTDGRIAYAELQQLFHEDYAPGSGDSWWESVREYGHWPIEEEPP